MALGDTARLIASLELQDKFSGPARNAEGALGRLEGRMSGFGRGVGQISRGIGQVGAGLDQALTRGAFAAAAGIGAVVTAAVSFEDAFAGVRKTVDASESQFGQLEDRLREMARTMPVSFQELASIAEAGGALGIAFEGLDEFTDVVAKLGTTTDLTVDQAATSLGVLGNVLGLQAEDFDNFGSALVDLGNKGASTETQIIGIAERMGAAGDLIGLSSDQVLGFAAAAANMGIEVEAGGSALQRFFIEALTAVESGGKGLETFARTAGVSAESFQKSFRDDAGAALTDFVEGLGQLPEAVQIETLQDLGFNDIRISRLLLGLANDADGLSDSLDIASKAFAENSALGTEAEKRYKTAASQLQILKNNVTDAAVVIGEQLLPAVTEVSGELVGWLNDPATQRGIKEFGENLASGIGDLVDAVRGADFGPLISTMQGAASVAKGAFDAFRSLPEPIQQLALAAIVANKVSGGAVGQIAGGLANILKGTFKLAFDRGGPANPMFVTVTNPGFGTGGPAAGGGRGVVGGLLGSVARWVIGPLAAAELGRQIGNSIIENQVADEREGAVDRIADIIASGDPVAQREALEGIRDTLDTSGTRIEDLPKQIALLLDGGGLRTTLEEQEALLVAQLAELKTQGQTLEKMPAGFTERLEAWRATLLDEDFETERHRRGMGTLPDTAVSFKDSPGVLPDTALLPVTNAINSLEPIAVEPGQVGAITGSMSENQQELQRIQAWQATMDPRLNAAVQGVNASVDSTRFEIASKGAATLSKQDATIGAVNYGTGVLERKNFSPHLSVNVGVTNNVSVSEIQRNVTSQIISSGFLPGFVPEIR